MRKTAVRVQEFKDEKLGFGFVTLTILIPTSAGSHILEPIGYIQFQRTLGDDGKWYGLSYKVDCAHSNINHLREMNKAADKVIKKCKEKGVSSYELQPVDVLDALNAERYGLFKSEFYPLDTEGQNLYDVMFLGSVYTRIAAADEAAAKKVMMKQGWDKHELKLNSTIIF